MVDERSDLFDCLFVYLEQKCWCRWKRGELFIVEPDQFIVIHSFSISIRFKTYFPISSYVKLTRVYYKKNMILAKRWLVSCLNECIIIVNTNLAKKVSMLGTKKRKKRKMEVWIYREERQGKVINVHVESVVFFIFYFLSVHFAGRSNKKSPQSFNTCQMPGISILLQQKNDYMYLSLVSDMAC